tara:strand:- start:6624 stop:6902 length:279 start_codon:yes stop_codon:yes gene_type:complete
MVEEIISHTLDEHRGTILIEFLYSINDINKTLNLELYLDELEDYGELYDDVQWQNYEEDTSTITHQKIDLLELQESLNSYIEDNPTVLEENL